MTGGAGASDAFTPTPPLTGDAALTRPCLYNIHVRLQGTLPPQFVQSYHAFSLEHPSEAMDLRHTAHKPPFERWRVKEITTGYSTFHTHPELVRSPLSTRDIERGTQTIIDSAIVIQRESQYFLDDAWRRPLNHRRSDVCSTAWVCIWQTRAHTDTLLWNQPWPRLSDSFLC